MTYERRMGRRSRSTTGLLDVRWMLRSTGGYKQVLPRRPPATLPSTSVGATRCDQGSAHVRRLSGDDRTHPVAGARAGRVKVTGPPTETPESDRRPRVARSGRSRRLPGESPDHLSKYMGESADRRHRRRMAGALPETTVGLVPGWLTGVAPEHLPIKHAALSRLPRGWSRRQRRGADERRLVSARQSGSSITTDSASRLPASPWPAETGAPRRNRTYNPLAGSRVITRGSRSASVLVSGGVPGFRSSLMLGQSASDSNVSVDQSGRWIMRRREILAVVRRMT